MEQQEGLPAASRDQLIGQIRFALSDLGSANAHHRFEELCRHFARERICSNILPATGPVSSAGDQGRDFETFQSFLRQELGAHGSFVGRISDRPMAFTCTLQKDDLAGKLRSDIAAIAGSGTPVAGVCTFWGVPFPVGQRHKLQDDIRDNYGIELQIFDVVALAEHLADHDLFWIAERFLSIPASFAPASTPDEPDLPDWYISDREKWRARGQANPTIGELLDLKDGLRHATFRPEARSDLPFWLHLVRELTADAVPRAVRQRARYELAAAQLRGLGDLRPADDVVRSFFLDAAVETDPARLADATVLLSYAGTASSLGHSNLEPFELREINIRLRDRVRHLLGEDPPPTRKARLLEVLGHLAVLPDPMKLPVRSAEEAVSIPDAATLIDLAADLHSPPDLGEHWKPIDIDEAMTAWSELGALLDETPLYPVDGFARILTFLTSLLVDKPGWRELEDAVDQAVARTEGGAAAAARARDRAVELLRADRIRDALRDLHSAKERWWSGDTLRGALLAMLLIAECYRRLRLPLAAKQYALTVAGAAQVSGDDDVADLVPRGILFASEVDYHSGAWCSALELLDIGLIAQRLLTDEEVNEAAGEHFNNAVMTVGMSLRAADQFLPRVAPAVRAMAQKHGMLEHLEPMIQELPEWSAEEWIRMTDEQLLGRPFNDLGVERRIRFAALGTRWTVRSKNDYVSARAAERFAAAAQLLLVELAEEDLCLLSTHIDVTVELFDGGTTASGAQWPSPATMAAVGPCASLLSSPGLHLTPKRCSMTCCLSSACSCLTSLCSITARISEQSSAHLRVVWGTSSQPAGLTTSRQKS